MQDQGKQENSPVKMDLAKIKIRRDLAELMKLIHTEVGQSGELAVAGGIHFITKGELTYVGPKTLLGRQYRTQYKNKTLIFVEDVSGNVIASIEGVEDDIWAAQSPSGSSISNTSPDLVEQKTNTTVSDAETASMAEDLVKANAQRVEANQASPESHAAQVSQSAQADENLHSDATVKTKTPLSTGAPISGLLLSPTNWVLASSALTVGFAASKFASSDSQATSTEKIVETILEGQVVAGPVVEGNGLKVVGYDYQGKLLGVAMVDGSGHYKLSIGDYKGAVALLVADSSDGADYVDEATKKSIDLAENLLLIGVVGSGSTKLNITPLTTVAALKAGVEIFTGANEVSVKLPKLDSHEDLQTKINESNSAVANAFGIGQNSEDLVSATIVTTVSKELKVNEHANAYGKVLAAISGMEEISKIQGDSGSTKSVTEALVEGMTSSGYLVSSVKQKLEEGAREAKTEVVVPVDDDPPTTLSFMMKTNQPNKTVLGVDAVIIIEVEFSEVVKVTGVPKLKINLSDSIQRQASYVGGSGTKKLVFDYKIQQNDGSSTNGIVIPQDAFVVSESAAIKDESENIANLSHAAMSANSSYSVDTVAPTVVITDNVAGTATGDVTFTYTFSEAVTGFDTSKVTVTGGTKGTFTAVSSTVYTLVVTPPASSTTAISLSTSTTGVTDAAGNVATAPGVYTQTVDTAAPTVVITDNVAGTATGDVTFTYTFSEAVTGFDTSKVTVTGGTKGTFTAVSSTVYTLVVTPPASSTTAISLSTSTTGVTDAVGNVATAPGVYTQAVDTAAPTVVITDNVAGTATGDVTFTYTFSEAVTGFDTSKVTVTGGTKGTFTAVSSTVYTLVVTPTSNSTTPITVTTSPSGVTSTSGSKTIASIPDYTQTVDTAAPTVVITDNVAGTATGDVTFTYTFSEAVTGFDTSKVTVTGGTKGTFTAVSSTVYTLVVTPPASSTTAISLSTSTTGVTDAVGNVATAPGAYTQAVDTVVPTVVITDNVAGTATGDVTFTYTFSEAVTGFDTSKVTVTGGTKGTFTAVSSTVYTLVVTPPASSTTAISLSTSTTGVTDAVGNVATAPGAYTQAVDTVAPTVVITDNVAGTATGDVTFTYTFSEAVTGFDTSKVTVTGGTKGTFTAVSSTVYTLVVTPTSNSTTPITVTTSPSGVTSTSGSKTIASIPDYTQAVDTVVPTVVITDNVAGTATGDVTFTYTFSEAVTDLTPAR